MAQSDPTEHGDAYTTLQWFWSDSSLKILAASSAPFARRQSVFNRSQFFWNKASWPAASGDTAGSHARGCPLLEALVNRRRLAPFIASLMLVNNCAGDPCSLACASGARLDVPVNRIVDSHHQPEIKHSSDATTQIHGTHRSLGRVRHLLAFPTARDDRLDQNGVA